MMTKMFRRVLVMLVYNVGTQRNLNSEMNVENEELGRIERKTGKYTKDRGVY